MRTFSQEDLLLRMTYPWFVFRVLSKEGHDLKRLFAHTGLTVGVLSDPEILTGFPPLRRFFLNAIEQTGEPHLGIRLAQQFEASFIGLPAYTAMNAATFEDALTVLSRFFFMTFPAIEFTFPDNDAEVQPGEFAIRLRPKLPLGDISYFASVSALVACEGLCKAILRTPKAALRGEMNISKPVGWADVEGQIGFPIRFEAPDIRLFLADVLLTRALPGEDPLNHSRLLALCERVAERAIVETTPVSKVVSFLQEGQNLALPISSVAAALGYSERGLRRRLERSGTTFQTLTNEIRERRARGMLANTDIPIKTIAHDLGFDTPSNFARSFKRWTGASPSAFRLAQRVKDVPGKK
ncbi:MAG: AraC family transcriptional regulator ligand-binding domain-containing protein [Blastocatellia bacterium]|nr:AraC family transcriptional regulator ligand-binding domain-containing protein [Blastocatellia bacterium]